MYTIYKMLINYIFNKISEKTKFCAFELLVGSSIIFLVCFVLYRIITGKHSKEKGTWTKKKYYELLPISVKTHDMKNISATKQNNASKGETECKRVLEKIFNKPFDKARPNFLSNPVTGGHNLELDCYNKELQLAVEYNGIQHYEFSPFFHKNKDQFQNQKYRDEMKKRLCLEHNITLIEVPYNVKIKDIENYLIKILKQENKL